MAGGGGHRGWLHDAGEKVPLCTDDGTYLMSIPRIELLNNELLSEDRPRPILRSDPSVVIRGHLRYDPSVRLPEVRRSDHHADADDAGAVGGDMQ